MKKHKSNPSGSPAEQSLRQRAEEVLEQQVEKLANLSPEEIQKLFYELSVHKIEMEMQNEELRLAQQQLEESRDRYVDLYDFAPIGYLTLSEKGMILKANLTGATMLGTDRRHLLNQPLSRFIFEKDQDIYYLHRKLLFETHQPQTCELRMESKNAPPFYVCLEVSVEQDNAGNAICLIVISNISRRIQAEKQKDAAMAEQQKINRQMQETLAELKQTQERMVRQERLAAVGQLSAGLAHDFNNILTGILGFSELMQLSPDTPAEMQPHLLHITTSSRRAAHLVHQLLDFSRKSIRLPKLLALDSFVIESVKFFELAIPENIQLNLKFGLGDYRIKADPTQLQQVITNLAVNARDAMPTGGTLDIGLLPVEMTDEKQCVTCGQPVTGAWVVLTITDTGSGIAENILPRIFEPFFTTKAVGKGTGLGLSQVYGIVKQHAGHIMVKSQVELGTTITIYFPSASKQNEELAEEPLLMLQGQGETILLIEDDATVLEAIKAMLERLRYRIITAENSWEALTVYQEHQTEISLVLSDMIMPGLTGEALFYALKTDFPDITMIMMSGYPLGKKGTELLEQGVVDWFQKPISLDHLSQVVNKALLKKQGG